mgnify:CR=1 FL=1
MASHQNENRAPAAFTGLDDAAEAWIQRNRTTLTRVGD